MPYINRELILRKLSAPNKRVEILARNFVAEKLEIKKKELINNLKNNEISQELMGDGSEDTGSLNGRSGNLRALIGFYPGDNPVNILEKALEKGIFLKRSSPSVRNNQGSINYRFSVQVPSLESLYQATPYPDGHTSGSWLRGIEKGIPGLRYYLYSTDPKKVRSFHKANSRSGYAIQAKSIVKSSPSKMTGVKYISQILENFKDSLGSV
jgi:hypothetical protein